MMFTAKIISSFCGIGLIKKGSGTIAAFLFCILWYVLARDVPAVISIGCNLVLLVAGVWSATIVEKDWGKDSHRVVIDELSGMGISLLLLPVTVKYIALAFILFRFFDIVKPLGIRKAEALPRGWGVMADDVLAGVYTNLLIQGILLFQLI